MGRVVCRKGQGSEEGEGCSSRQYAGLLPVRVFVMFGGGEEWWVRAARGHVCPASLPGGGTREKAEIETKGRHK